MCMVKYTTKEELGEEIIEVLKGEYLNKNYSANQSFIPFLAFENHKGKVECECGGDGYPLHKFQYNISATAGADKVIFEWDLDLKRVYLTGHFCESCQKTEVKLHENSPEKEGEIVY